MRLRAARELWPVDSLGDRWYSLSVRVTEGRSIADVLRALAQAGLGPRGRSRVFGLRGSAPAYLVARFLEAHGRPSVVDRRRRTRGRVLGGRAPLLFRRERKRLAARASRPLVPLVGRRAAQRGVADRRDRRRAPLLALPPEPGQVGACGHHGRGIAAALAATCRAARALAVLGRGRGSGARAGRTWGSRRRDISACRRSRTGASSRCAAASSTCSRQR